MPTLSPLSILTVAWVAVTVVFLSLWFYRSLVGMKEEDTLVLSAAESKMEEEQRQIQTRLHQIRPYLRGFGWASVALLVAVAGIWLYRGLKDFV
ncbi:MAG: hypothetical protein WBE37_11560 [Bryobacteraceae bacterium]